DTGHVGEIAALAVVGRDPQRRVGLAGQHVVDAGLVLVAGVGDRADDGQLVGVAGQGGPLGGSAACGAARAGGVLTGVGGGGRGGRVSCRRGPAAAARPRGTPGCTTSPCPGGARRGGSRPRGASAA